MRAGTCRRRAPTPSGLPCRPGRRWPLPDREGSRSSASRISASSSAYRRTLSEMETTVAMAPSFTPHHVAPGRPLARSSRRRSPLVVWRPVDDGGRQMGVRANLLMSESQPKAELAVLLLRRLQAPRTSRCLHEDVGAGVSRAPARPSPSFADRNHLFTHTTFVLHPRV